MNACHITHPFFYYYFDLYNFLFLCSPHRMHIKCKKKKKNTWHFYRYMVNWSAVTCCYVLLVLDSISNRNSLWHRKFTQRRMRTETQGWSRDTTKKTQTVSWLRFPWVTWTYMTALISHQKEKISGKLTLYSFSAFLSVPCQILKNYLFTCLLYLL